MTKDLSRVQLRLRSGQLVRVHGPEALDQGLRVTAVVAAADQVALTERSLAVRGEPMRYVERLLL